MKNTKTYNTYQSITLWHYTDGTTGQDSARIFTSVENVKLKLHLDVTYYQGKREMVKLMLRFGKLPEVRRYENFTVYDIHGFFD